MPTIVWLMGGAGLWLAALGATGALLTAAKRANAAADAGAGARGPRRRGCPGTMRVAWLSRAAARSRAACASPNSRQR